MNNIGRGTYGTPEIKRWTNNGQLQIGQYCSISSGVKILLGGEHRPDWVSTYPFVKTGPDHPKTKGDVVIGNDVWIGMDVLILSGVTIGDGAVIGAGSVVTKDVGPYEIWAGNPARFLRRRFTEEQIKALQAIAWWDWADGEIEQAQIELMSDDIDGFIRKYGGHHANL